MYSVENLITSYLFQNRVCPLPTIGTLRLEEGNAILETAEKKISPPRPIIRFHSHELPADDLLNYIAVQKNIPVENASGLLSEYCTRLQNLDAFTEVPLQNAGKFYIGADGNLLFKSIDLPDAFFPAVHAERVIHPEASHAILVGDKETTNTVMTEFYNEEEVVKKSKWWIWPILLFVVSMIMIIIYFNDRYHSPSMGNANKIIPAVETKTYDSSQ